MWCWINFIDTVELFIKWQRRDAGDPEDKDRESLNSFPE